MNRRQFLGAGAITAGGLWLPASASAAPVANIDLTKGSRVLDIYRPETRERLHIEYMRDGKWIGDSYNQLCWLMRDWKAGKHVAMDHRLIAILDWTQTYLRQYGYHDPVHLLSGHRTAQNNAKTEGAAKDSEHVKGTALDLRFVGLSADYLGDLFRWLSQGGVGTYSRATIERDFVHVDTGRVRRWKG